MSYTSLSLEEFWPKDTQFEGAVDNFLSTSSMSSRTYGSRDRTFDFLDVEDDNEDLFDDALNVSTVLRKIFMKRGDDQMLMT